jgi:hypothetical protein
VIGKDYNLYYSVWCHGEHELYDLQKDEYQINNLLDSDKQNPLTESETLLLGLPIAKVTARLDSLILVLKSCKGERCINPWGALHPGGGVLTLKQALSPRFDSFYEKEQIKVKYNRCELGYIIDSEGPQFDVDGLVFRDGASWSDWV